MPYKIKITEKELHGIIKESVKMVLSEKTFLNEGASKRLFHYIDTERLIRMLRNNRFYPSEPEMFNNVNDGKKEYTDGKGQRFMSFTRNKNFHSGYPVLAYGEVGTYGDDGIVCRIELDGDALNTYNNFKTKTRWGKRQNNFKVKPMDFIYKDYGDGVGDPNRIQDETGVYAHNGKEWMMKSDDVTYFGWDGMDAPPLPDKYAHSMSQAEDRLTTTAKSIPNANKYITRIDIYSDPRMNSTDEEQEIIIKQIQKYASKLGIPVILYNNIKDFSLQR